MNLNIRLEVEKDYQKTEEITREAFWNLYQPGCDEHFLLHTMRNHTDFISDLDYVAEIDGQIVGNIVYTRSYVINQNNEKMETVTFGPLCVHPRYQRMGLGTKLIEVTKNIVIQKGYPAMIILGDPHNYCKHGFKTGKDYRISTMDGKFPLGLLVLELKKGIFEPHQWRFQESSVYNIDRSKVSEYDERFPVKEKAHTYSQELFSMLIRAVVE